MTTLKAKTPLRDRIQAFFHPNLPSVSEDVHDSLFEQYYEGTGLTHVVKHPYKVSNQDEAGTPINSCYIGVKWAELPKSTVLNAADLDPLWLSYGKSEADRLWRQLTDPGSGHSAILQAIAAWERGDLGNFIKNQKRNLAALEAAYTKYERISSAFI